MRKQYSFLLGILLLISCEDKFLEADTDFGYDYFPLSVGSYIIYDVQEINFDASGPDTTNYELRNTITEKIDQGDESVYLLKREKRMNETLEWKVADVWMLRQDQFNGIVTEENIPFVKVTFPVIIDKTWDGNAFNTSDFKAYQYREAEPSSYDNLIPDLEKIKVQISDIPQNIVNRDERFEVYAKGVGLVEKNYVILNYCTANCGSEEVDSGIIIEQVLKAYGQD